MDQKHLHILWTNADPVTGMLMVLMYAKNSLKKHWWDEVTVILWGGTTALVVHDLAIQAEVKEAQSCGVRFCGCIACAEELGVVAHLERLSVALKPWGPPLTELLQTGAPLLTV